MTNDAWNRTVILARVREVLDPVEYERLEQRLAGEIAGAEAAWLEHVLNAAAALPLPAPPAELSAQLREMFNAVPATQRLEAVLTNDSRLEQQLAGVRGPTDSTDGWTLTYTTGVGNLLVDVWPNGEVFDIEAQLMPATGSARFSLSIVARSTGGVPTHSVTSDRLGRAAVNNVQPGRHDVTIERPGAIITTHLDLAGQ